MKPTPINLTTCFRFAGAGCDWGARPTRLMKLKNSSDKGGAAILHFLLISRPYSYSDNFIRGALSCALVGQGTNPRSLIIATLVSIFMWLFLNWYSESRQRDPGRRVPPTWLVWAPFALTLAICSYATPTSIPYLAIYAATIFLYPLKAMRKSFGPLGPVMRGLTIIAHCLLVISCVGEISQLSPSNSLFIATLGLYHGSRNLVGDIRDIDRDRYETPARFGLAITMWVLRGAFAMVLGLSLLYPWGFASQGLPLIVQWGALEVMAWRFGKAEARWIGYLGHVLFVVTFTVSEILMGYFLGVDPYLCLLAGLILIILLPTYRRIPGKNYSEWIFPQQKRSGSVNP